jgi:hypothetical protein
MTLPTEAQLETLSREELISLVRQLQARVAELEAELAKLRQPSVSSRNSSLPPSRDRKADLPGRHRPKRGPLFGH